MAGIDDLPMMRLVQQAMLFPALKADMAVSGCLGETEEEQLGFLDFALGHVDRHLQPLQPPFRQADVIALDQNIDLCGQPRLLGTDLVARLRNAGFTGAACIVSGGEPEAVARLGALPGVDVATGKGFDAAELAALLLEALARRRRAAAAASTGAGHSGGGGGAGGGGGCSNLAGGGAGGAAGGGAGGGEGGDGDGAFLSGSPPAAVAKEPRASTSAAGAAPIDASAFDLAVPTEIIDLGALYEALGGSRELLMRVARDARRSISVEALRAALAVSDLAAVGEEAHRLAGAASCVRARSLVVAAHRLETFCAGQRPVPEAAPVLVQYVCDHAANLVAALTAVEAVEAAEGSEQSGGAGSGLWSRATPTQGSGRAAPAAGPACWFGPPPPPLRVQRQAAAAGEVPTAPPPPAPPFCPAGPAPRSDEVVCEDD